MRKQKTAICCWDLLSGFSCFRNDGYSHNNHAQASPDHKASPVHQPLRESQKCIFDRSGTGNYYR